MKNINWKLRLTNKYFWLSAIPALALVVQAIASVFGFEYDFSDTVNKLIVVVNAVFAFLVVLGLVNDPTTEGVTDSEKVMTYEKPNGGK
jgi:phi LC3 family holin